MILGFVLKYVWPSVPPPELGYQPSLVTCFWGRRSEREGDSSDESSELDLSWRSGADNNKQTETRLKYTPCCLFSRLLRFIKECVSLCVHQTQRTLGRQKHLFPARCCRVWRDEREREAWGEHSGCWQRLKDRLLSGFVAETLTTVFLSSLRPLDFHSVSSWSCDSAEVIFWSHWDVTQSSDKEILIGTVEANLYLYL